MRFSTIETYFPPRRGKPRAATIGCMIWEFFGHPWPKSKKKKNFIFDIGVFVGWSVTVGEGTISPEEKSLLKLYMITHIFHYHI